MRDEDQPNGVLLRRLMLLNQYIILEHVDREQSDTWRRAADAVIRHLPDDELPYANVLAEHAREPFTTADRRELLDTLELFFLIQEAQDAGHAVPEGLEAPTAFPGYCGNEESGHLAYYRDLVADGRRWIKLRKANPRDLNSHFPVRKAYARMVAEWGRRGWPRPLRADDFRAILSEWVHPDLRR